MRKVTVAASAVALMAVAWVILRLAWQPALLSCDFEADPIRAGWTQPSGSTTANWSHASGRTGGRALYTDDGAWESPAFPVDAFQYYRVTFWVRVLPRQPGTPWPDGYTAPAAPDGYPGVWAAISFGRDGTPLPSDHYWAIDLSPTWTQVEFVTYGKAGAASMKLHWEPYAKTRMWIDDVTVERIPEREAAAWVNDQWRLMPQTTLARPERRWARIRRTMEALAQGETVRVVMLGDSICGDIANSAWQALVSGAYPQASLAVISSVRGGTGNTWFQQDNRIKAWVLDHRPSLVMLAGISHAGDAEATRAVIRQIRASSDTEIAFMTPVVGPGDPCQPGDAHLQSLRYSEAMKAVAEEEQVEFIDLTTPWTRYVCTSGKPIDWFRRDFVHANQRGAVVLAKIVESYFSPHTK